MKIIFPVTFETKWYSGFQLLHKNALLESYFLRDHSEIDTRLPDILALYAHLSIMLTSWNTTRRSENDNTPQPLDQWTNSPFIGQQVGNCKSFTMTHYLADLFAMHHGPRSIPLCIQHHIQFIPSESTLPFLNYSNFNIQPWKSKVKVMGEVKVWSHNVSLTFYRHIPLVPCQSAIPFLRYDFWPWKSKVKVMEEVNIESHNMGPTFCRLKSLPFHVNLPSHSWDTAFSKFDLENPRSKSWVKWTFKVTKWV